MRTSAILILVLALAGASFGLDSPASFTDTIAAGTASLTVTNSLAYKELVSVGFHMPSAVTNTFTIDHLRDKWEKTYGSKVSTNLFETVETNSYVSAITIATITNRILSATRTNSTSNVFDTRDDADDNRLPLWYYIEKDDRLVYTFTYTNDVIRLIRNMK